MKILMLSWEYPPRIVGGISRVVYDLTAQLGTKNNEVHVITCSSDSQKEYEKNDNVYLYRVNTYNINTNFVHWVHHLNFAMIEQGIKIINKLGRFDIIHAHDWIVAFAARTLKEAYQIPLVSTIHATEYGRNNGLHNEMQEYISSAEWFLTYESWKVICNSNYMKNELQHIFQLPQDKIEVIPNGVDTEKFIGIERDYNFRRRYASDNEKIVFFVGRLVYEKGVNVLIDSMPKIINHYNNAKFIIAGKGPQLEYLKNRANELGVSHKVYFTGYISDEDLLKLYKCSDISVFPSIYEPFGIVALEGMVASVPVVVSDIGGMDEIVNHGFDGMKAYAGNANSLADSILALLFDQELCKKCVKNAMMKILQYYTWDIISDKTINIYKQVIQESNKSWEKKDYKNLHDKGIRSFVESPFSNTEIYYQDTYRNEH